MWIVSTPSPSEWPPQPPHPPQPPPVPPPPPAAFQFGCGQVFVAGLIAVGILVSSTILLVAIDNSNFKTMRRNCAILAAVDLVIVVGAMFLLRPAIRSGRLTVWVGGVVGFALSALLNTFCAQVL